MDTNVSSQPQQQERKYEVRFDRIANQENVAPLQVTGDANQMAEAIGRYASRFMVSSPSVTVDLSKLEGYVFAGFFTVSHFTLSVS